MAERASREQVVAYRIAAQALHRPASDLIKLAVLDIGVQDSGAESARLAFDARLPRTPPADRIGPDEPLALVWSLRGAPYVHRRADLDRVAGALWPLSEADAAARMDSSSSMRKAKLPVLDGYAQAVTELRRIVRKPMGKGAVSAELTKAVPPAMTRNCRVCKATHVFELPLRMGSLSAGLELEPQTAPPVLRPRPRARRIAQTDVSALQELVHGYLALLGPASQADVAGYLGMRRADLVGLWPDGLAQVEVDGRTGFLPEAQLPALRKPPAPDLVRLLGPFDPYLQARDRDVIVPDTSVHKALWPVLGRPGVVLADGEVVGTWRTRGSGKRLTVTVEGFVPLPPPIRRAVEEEAQRVAAVRGVPEAAVVWTV